jgi:GAF domain-containing protein
MPSAAERLQLLYEVNRRLATFVDLDELIRYTTRRIRELFAAAGCALLLCDRQRGEFRFPVASQSAAQHASEARLAEVRFPIDRGIAGWVLSRGESVAVADVARDPRFFRGVDDATRMTTRALLCAPLRTEKGNIGVIEVVNPSADAMDPGDLEFLEALACDFAAAHQKAALHALLRTEVMELRQAMRLAGAGLGVIGLLIAAGAALGHVASALPLHELLTHSGLWVGSVLLAIGAAMLAVGSRARRRSAATA